MNKECDFISQKSPRRLWDSVSAPRCVQLPTAAFGTYGQGVRLKTKQGWGIERRCWAQLALGLNPTAIHTWYSLKKVS